MGIYSKYIILTHITGRGVFNGTVGRYIFTQMPLSVTVGARAHCRSLLRLNEHCGHVSATASAGTVAPQWKHGQLRCCAPLQSGIRRKPSVTENRKKPDRLWRVSSNASARCPPAFTLMRSIFAPWNIRLTPCAPETQRGTKARMCWSRNGRPWFVTAAAGGARAARGARAGAIRGWVAARLPGQGGRKWTT